MSLRAAGCFLLKENDRQEKPCQPCSHTLSSINRQTRYKSKATAQPAKDKAPLSACGPEKLRATVKSTRLQKKQLEGRIEQLQKKLEKDAIGVSETLKTDILKIMSGQNLEATPHMKFFWEQQIALLQAPKMGRRYHPQVIRFALSLHAKSP